MENVTKSIISNVLKEHCKIIVQDIQGDVILILYEKQVLTENEYNDIKSKVSRKTIILIISNFYFIMCLS